MAETFYTILTNIGKARIANATALGTLVNVTTLVVGDGLNGGYYNPTEDQTALKHQVWQGAINAISIDEQNANWIVIEAVIPSDVGGFTVREAGILDDQGNLLAVGKYPETYKPVLADGSAKDLYIRMILEVTNAASVTLKIDPATVLVTKKYVDDTINAHAQNLSIHVTATEKTTWNRTLSDANAYTDQQISLVTETGISKLMSYPYVLTATTANQKDFSIPLSSFEAATDTVMVVQNRTLLSMNDYTIVNVSGAYKVRLTEGVAVGTEISLLILKNVPQGADGSISAKVLADGTLSIAKLEAAAKTTPGGTEAQRLAVTNDQGGVGLADRLVNCRKTLSSKDANGIYLVVEYRRLADNTLSLRATLSNPDANGNYQTDTRVYYRTDGVTVAETVVLTLTYDADGMVIDEVFAT